MDIAIVLDLSEYLDPSILSGVASLAKKIVQGLPIQASQTLVSLVTYAYNATINFNLNTYTSTFDVLNTFSFTGSLSSRSNLQDALRQLQTVFTPGRGDRGGVPNIAIILTDGFATPSDPAFVGDLANIGRSQNNIDYYVVALGDVSSTLYAITAIVANRIDRISYLTSPNDIDKVSGALLDTLCQ